jgi:hypothetical protein
MLKIFAVALLAIPMTVGSVQAKGHALPACSDGQQAKASCACGTTKGKSSHCAKGDYCHAFSGTCSK